MKNSLSFTTFMLTSFLSTATLANEEFLGLPKDVEVLAKGSEASQGRALPKPKINLGVIQDAFFESDDSENVKYVQWTPDVTTKVRLRVGMQTILILPDGETISSASLGNSFAFKIGEVGKKFPNRLIVTPSQVGVDTNLVVIGESGNVYSFYLFSDPLDSEYVPDLVVYIIDSSSQSFKPFQYDRCSSQELKNREDPKEEPIQTRIETLWSEEKLVELAKTKDDYLATLADPSTVNTAYKMYGDEEVAPFAVYDDAQWTYFDFRGILASDRLPVAYKVVDGFDSVVNTRMEKGFMIAESLSPEGWTLKNGNKTICIKPTKDLHKIHGKRSRAVPVHKPSSENHAIK